MKITSVTIVMNATCERHVRLRAYASFVIDDRFVVHGCKVVEGANGMIVSMPNRKATIPCAKCQEAGFAGQCPVTDDFCGRCGEQLPEFEIRTQDMRKPNGKLDMHRDVCHPLDREMRLEIERAILDRYRGVTCQTPTE